MSTGISLPPSSRYIGRRVTATWHEGATVTGVLIGVRGAGLTIREGHSDTPIRFEALASLHEANPETDDNRARDLIAERLNDIRDQLMQAAAQLPTVTGTHVHPAAAGVFGMDLADGGRVVVDLWHDN